MPDLLKENDFNILKQSLPAAFRESFIDEDESALRAYPLLAIICNNAEALAALRSSFNIEAPARFTPAALAAQAKSFCDKLLASETACNHEAIFKYRLTHISGEFPIHSRAINNKIKEFNRLIENYHQQSNSSINKYHLEAAYKSILNAILNHGALCESDSLWQLLSMMAGWSTESPQDLFSQYPTLIFPPAARPTLEQKEILVEKPKEKIKASVIDSEEPNKTNTENPFIPNYNYNFNRAGRLASETDTLLLNAFGMKIGGHFDAQVKHPPKFMPISQLHAIIDRQLSHRMAAPKNAYFKAWIEKTLANLGVEYKNQNPNDLDSEIFVNPFLSQPLSFLNPQKIRLILRQNLEAEAASKLDLKKSDLEIIAQYLFELLQGFQINPGQGLGIGANWDGTINLSNEAGAYPFKFQETEAEWGARFKQLSMHRQGPAEAYMNAAKGIKYEVESLFIDFDYMSQLQVSEYNEVLYNALIDNLVSELFPEPAYHENTAYKKFRKQHIVQRTEDGAIQIESFYQPSSNGTYFKDRKGLYKQTPMHRQAGTLDVQPFPKNTGCSENSRASYDGNPLAPLQQQYAQSVHATTRGHIAYDPIGRDQFIPDLFYGQIVQHQDGDFLPYMGVVPKNFDKHFKQENELCASFVIRMLQSSRIMEYCPTFYETLQNIKTRFLPPLDSQLPALPDTGLAPYIKDQHQELQRLIQNEDRDFANCQKVFYGLFKNLVYGLYEYGKFDNNFKNFFIPKIITSEAFQPFTRANCEKLIRDLTINKPVTVSEDALKKYNARIEYLSALLTYFYPKPTEAMATQIAREAKACVEPLSQSKMIRAYFHEMRHVQQANLSRRQTPGMAYAALKHGGPSQSIAKDYKEMHEGNFLSGYRDPEGNQMGEPQFHEKLIDWFAKNLGASLQLMQKYNLFAVLRRPLSQWYVQGKELANQHEDYIALWLALGAIKGFFWDGLAKGLVQTLATPFEMLFDFGQWLLESDNANEKNLKSALTISAAPANDPGLKVETSRWVRDNLLHLLRQCQDSNEFVNKHDYINHILKYQARPLLHTLYPQLRRKDKIACYDKLRQTFPLNKKSWRQLFSPFHKIMEEGTYSTALNILIFEHSPHINRDFSHALFACASNAACAKRPKEIIEEMRSFYNLNPNQIKTLTAFVKYYNQIPFPDEKKNFVALFQFNGKIQKALRARDQQLQKIQNWILNIFDPQWLPENPLKINSHAKILAAITSLNEIAASTKDREHRKWASFAERELKHNLFAKNEIHGIFADLERRLKQSPNLINKLEALKFHCLPLNNAATITDAALNEFYISAHCIKGKINEPEIKKSAEAGNLLGNFIDVTMNAVINARLDQLDILSETPESIANPLLKSEVIEQWLQQLQAHPHDLRALLEQQVQQSPSLDHALWRNKCILQVLEKSHPAADRIHKTGMQTLVRFWTQHKENVTRSGEIYINPRIGQPKALSPASLFNGSRTLQYAGERVSRKSANILRRSGCQ